MNDKIRKIPVEIYSRVVGYFQPVNQWNKGKKSEFDDRKNINLDTDKVRNFINTDKKK